MSGWNKKMIKNKLVICDESYIEAEINIYIKDFIYKCEHFFINSGTTKDIISNKLSNYSNYNLVLFHVSNSEITEYIKTNFNVFNCNNDINIFSIEMSLMSLEEFISAHKLCQVVTVILDKYNVNYYATGGTKIGILRNQNLLPWDWDLDFIIMDRKENVLTPKFKNELLLNNIKITDGSPLPKDFKLNIKTEDFFLDMICLNKTSLNLNEKYLCHSYYVNILKDSKLGWNEWEEYIESAYFYCHIVYNQMGKEKYKKEGVKIYEQLSYENRFKIEEYKTYLKNVFDRYIFEFK